ncbi:MAG: AAA family ATPase [Candidatus Cloacimonetes bacterium]|nr:AAA family ATPase [Candidatus Cloacimonadota bacterium]
MRIKSLWVKEYKNLKDVYIDFDENNWITALIGWNGTGKSNVIEALSVIFRDLIQTKHDALFSFKIAYICNNYLIEIDALSAKDFLIERRNGANRDKFEIVICNLDNQNTKEKYRLQLNKFYKDEIKYIPRYIFGYYSGNSDRMQKIFLDYGQKYDRELRQGKDPGARRLFFTLPAHSQFVLLAFILQQDKSTQEFLEKQLGIDTESAVDSVLFVLKQPPWKNQGGDHRFWNAEGIVSRFLSDLFDLSIAPIRIKRTIDTTLWNTKKQEFLYLYIKDIDTLKKLIIGKTPKELFRDLESTYVSELIEEVRIFIKLKNNDGYITFNELSEGERQLLTVLGLLKFTSEDESLILLDEPDTHLNPKWSTDYFDFLRNIVATSGNDYNDKSHIIVTTHNPLSIAELIKEQVQILIRDPEKQSISVKPPIDDPRGMGYAGIITSDMFGLGAALDKHTLELLEERRLITLKETPLSEKEKERVSEINQILKPYGFQHEARDPKFRDYLKSLQKGKEK